MRGISPVFTAEEDQSALAALEAGRRRRDGLDGKGRYAVT